jgi:hypothetical protein
LAEHRLGRLDRVGCAGIALGLLVAFVAPSFLITPASAQDRPRTLMELLFRKDGGKADRKQPAVKKKAAPPKRKIATAPAEPEAAVKLDTARTVMVVGDFMAAGLAEGLVPVFSANPEVMVIDRTQGLSGLVRDDVKDWPVDIGGLIAKERPAAVLVMIGANDRQAMDVGRSQEQAMSPPWIVEYTKRANALATAVSKESVPLIWVGLPAFKSTRVSQDIVAFNDIYRAAAEGVGGTFVDIWDGFVDENGAFVTSGPDMNGQPVRLRTSDGVNLSKAGKRKVAFYAEKPLDKAIGGATMPELDPLGPGAPPSDAFPVDVSLIDRTLPVALTDPNLDGGKDLLGFFVTPKRTEAASLAEKLAIEGVAPDPRAGRADDFGPYEAPPVIVVSLPTVPAPALPVTAWPEITVPPPPIPRFNASPFWNTVPPEAVAKPRLYVPEGLIDRGPAPDTSVGVPPLDPSLEEGPVDVEPADTAAGPETTTAISR